MRFWKRKPTFQPAQPIIETLDDVPMFYMTYCCQNTSVFSFYANNPDSPELHTLNCDNRKVPLYKAERAVDAAWEKNR